jgi:uncharacterized membrane protein YfcA
LTAPEVLALSATAFVTSALTAVVGAGGGTALIAVMLQILPPAAAIPVHGAVQLASNATRVWLLRRHMAWPVIWRFALPMPLGVWLGLALFQGLPAAAIELLIGCFVLLTLALRRIGRWRDREMPLWAFLPIGFVTGALNMVVGVIAPILGALIVRRDLSKEATVGTLGFFGLAGNLLKIAGFSLIGFSFAEYGPLIAGMVPAAILGTRAGRHLLGRIDERRFLLAFRIVLAALALKLIAVDGIAALLG